MKQLTQAIFDGAPDWVKSAAICPRGVARCYSVASTGFYSIHEKYGHIIKCTDREVIADYDYDTTDWQNSAIDREVAA